MTFRPLRGHAFHAKTDAELRYIIKDAGEAYKAISTFDGQAAGKYADQVNDAVTVLAYRARKAADKAASTKRATDAIRRLSRPELW